MNRGLAALSLLLIGTAVSHAEAYLYKLGPVPKQWQTPFSKPKGGPPGNLRNLQRSAPQVNANKWERDFSAPIDSPNFGKPIDESAAGVKANSVSGQPAADGIHPYQQGTLLISSQPGQLFLNRKDTTVEVKYLYNKGIVFETSSPWQVGFIRTAEVPPPSEFLMALVLTGKAPEDLVFRDEGTSKGLTTESWMVLGFPRIRVARQSDGKIVSGSLLAPASQKQVSVWRVKSWQKGVPAQVVCTNFSTDGQSLNTETLFTLAETRPSPQVSASNFFPLGLEVLDRRVAKSSQAAEVSYKWPGSLPDAEAIAKLDSESEAFLPEFLKGSNAALNGTLLLGAVGGLLFGLLWAAKKKSSSVRR